MFGCYNNKYNMLLRLHAAPLRRVFSQFFLHKAHIVKNGIPLYARLRVSAVRAHGS